MARITACLSYLAGFSARSVLKVLRLRRWSSLNTIGEGDCPFSSSAHNILQWRNCTSTKAYAALEVLRAGALKYFALCLPFLQE